METTSRILVAFSVALLVFSLPVYGQPGTLPCTPAMVNSFTPCMNFLNNATANVTTPTPDCCNSLKSLTTNSSGCLCLLVSGNVPFPIPINRTLAISLPQACNMPGVPVQCKASTTAPVPAPGPATLPESPSPAAVASPMSPPAASPMSPPAASDTPPAVPGPTASTTPTTTTPSATNGGTAAPSPSSAISSTGSPLLVVLGLGILSMIYA